MTYASADLIERAAARLEFEPPPVFLSIPAPSAPMERQFEVDAHRPTNIHRLERGGTIDWATSRAPITEEIRLIKRRLLRRAAEAAVPNHGLSRLVMITSAKPGEGKTFTATNLALSIALEEDYEVVLVDADINKQSLRRNFGLKSAPGFIDILLDPSVPLSDVLLRTDIPRLSVLPAGTMSERAPELMAGNRMRGMIASLARRFPDRIIIFDAPPCLVSTDASTLASHVGQTLLVIEADETQEHEISAALQLIGNCPDISLVLNKARPGRSTAYGSYGAY